MTFAVLTKTISGYEDCWTVTDQDGSTRPERFDTKQAAKAEIDDIFSEYQLQVRQGERDTSEVPASDEYIIVTLEEIKTYIT